MAIAFVQVGIGSNGGISNDTVITISASGAGNLLTLMGAWGDTSSITGIVDNQGNTWVQAPSARADSGRVTDVWYAKNCSAGTTTVTATLNGTPGSQWAVYEFSGASTTAPLVSAANTSNPGAGGPPVSPTRTPAIAGEALIACCMPVSANLSGVQAPWTGQTPLIQNGSSFAYYVNPPLSSQQAAWNPTGNQNYASSIALFQPPAAPSTNKGRMFSAF